MNKRCKTLDSISARSLSPTANNQLRVASLIARWAKRWLWDTDLRLKRNGRQAVALFILSAIALTLELSFHSDAFSIRSALAAKQVRVFYNVQDVTLSNVETPIALILIVGSIARMLFGVIIGLADVVLYRRITGRAFDWEAMINICAVNCVFLLTILFTFMNPAITRALNLYQHLIAHVPTIAHFSGWPALVIACLIGDFCFYWTHRWCHEIRFFWNLGHVNHHRSRNLSQLTQAVDPQSFLLNTDKICVLLLLPLLTKLFFVHIHDCGLALIIALVFDALTDPSHSVVLYQAELRCRSLRTLRWVFVTAAVHFTHHSREKKHNISDGCNFRCTIDGVGQDIWHIC